MEFGSEQDTEQLCNSSKEKISLGCDGVEGFSSLKAENRFKGADGTLNSGTLGIKDVPFVRIANETGIKAIIGIGVLEVEKNAVSDHQTGHHTNEV